MKDTLFEIKSMIGRICNDYSIDEDLTMRASDSGDNIEFDDNGDGGESGGQNDVDGEDLKNLHYRTTINKNINTAQQPSRNVELNPTNCNAENTISGGVNPSIYFTSSKFLSEKYDDSESGFNTIFKITSDSSIMTVALAVVNFTFENNFKEISDNNGTVGLTPMGDFSLNYRDNRVGETEHIVKIQSHFFNNRNDMITNFDIIALFVVMLSAKYIFGTSKSQPSTRFNPAWLKMHMTLNERRDEDIYFNDYADALKILNELKNYPRVQGYLKEAFHMSKNDVDGTSIRGMLKQRLYSMLGDRFDKIYNNTTYKVLYIPYLDAIRPLNECEVIGAKLLSLLRDAIIKQKPELQNLSDSDFWKSELKGTKSVVTNSMAGMNSITDEMVNLIKEWSYHSDNSIENFSSARRFDVNRERKISDEISKAMGGVRVGPDDIVRMKSMSPMEWLKSSVERDVEKNDKLLIGYENRPFSIKAIYNLLNEFKMLEEAGNGKYSLKDEYIASGGSGKKVTAYDFFETLIGDKKNKSTQEKIFKALVEKFSNSGLNWYGEFNNSKNTPSEISQLVKNVRDRGLGRQSIDMFNVREGENGILDLISIEYQGEQHYKPGATTSLSQEELYPFSESGDAKIGTFKWGEYWGIIETLLMEVSFIQKQNSQLKEGVNIKEAKTTKKAFFEQYRNLLEDVATGEKNIKIRNSDYNFATIYNEVDSFDRWVSSNSRPKMKISPVKVRESGYSDFSNSCLRWFAEMDTVVQVSSDISKFLLIKDGKVFGDNVGSSEIYYICPNNSVAISSEIISNILHCPYQGAFYEDLKSISLRNDIEIEGIAQQIFNRTFRLDMNGNEIDISKCISVGDGQTLLDAIKNKKRI